MSGVKLTLHFGYISVVLSFELPYLPVSVKDTADSGSPFARHELHSSYGIVVQRSNIPEWSQSGTMAYDHGFVDMSFKAKSHKT